MAIPKRTITATCDIDAGTLVFSEVGPIFTGENAATSVEVSLTKGGSAYSPAGLLVEMYLYWPGAASMSVAVTMTVSGSTVTGNMPDVLTALPGTPLLVLQISDDINGDLIVAAAAPINITAVRGGIVVSAGAPSPSEVVYIGRSPYVDPTTHKWMEWDNNSRMYVDTGYYAASAEQIDAANVATTAANNAASAANTAATSANNAATSANTAATQIDSKINNKFAGIQSDMDAMVYGMRDGHYIDLDPEYADDPYYQRNMQTYLNEANIYAQNAYGSAQTSKAYQEQSEAYAAGTKNGTAVGSTDPAYHNNSKYYAEQAHAELSGLEGEVTDLKSALFADNAPWIKELYINADGVTAGITSITAIRVASDQIAVIFGDNNAVRIAITQYYNLTDKPYSIIPIYKIRSNGNPDTGIIYGYCVADLTSFTASKTLNAVLLAKAFHLDYSPTIKQLLSSVTYTAQELTDNQKSQARNNIDVWSKAEIGYPLRMLITSSSDFVNTSQSVIHGGTQGTYTNYNTTDFVECTPGDILQFRLEGYYRVSIDLKLDTIAFYDASETYIDGIYYTAGTTGAGTVYEGLVNVPTGAKYFKALTYDEVVTNPYVYILSNGLFVETQAKVACIGDSLTQGLTGSNPYT